MKLRNFNKTGFDPCSLRIGFFYDPYQYETLSVPYEERDTLTYTPEEGYSVVAYDSDDIESHNPLGDDRLYLVKDIQEAYKQICEEDPSAIGYFYVFLTDGSLLELEDFIQKYIGV